MRSAKNDKQFTIISELKKGDVRAKFSHKIDLVRKKPGNIPDGALPKKYHAMWYMKKIKNNNAAIRELVGQEFFRLLIPNHPKTRITNDGASPSYVLSKEVPSFQTLDEIPQTIVKEHIQNHVYKGLGDVLVVSLLLNEIDLKFGNLGIDDQDHFIKIDGDWCFARLTEQFKSHNFIINEKGLRDLPFLFESYAFNWLDIILADTLKTSKIFDKDFSKDLYFRAEVNSTILRILILPDDLIKAFINSYITGEDAANIYNEITQRKSALKEAALANKDFKEYVKSDPAKETFINYRNYLQNFKTTSKNHLVIDNLKNRLEQKFESLRKEKNNLFSLFPSLTLDKYSHNVNKMLGNDKAMQSSYFKK